MTVVMTVAFNVDGLLLGHVTNQMVLLGTSEPREHILKLI